MHHSSNERKNDIWNDYISFFGGAAPISGPLEFSPTIYTFEIHTSLTELSYRRKAGVFRSGKESDLVGSSAEQVN